MSLNRIEAKTHLRYRKRQRARGVELLFERHEIKFRTAVVSVFLAVALCLTMLPYSSFSLLGNAHAASLNRGDVSRAVSGGIVLDADLHTKEPIFGAPMESAITPSDLSTDMVQTYYRYINLPAKTYRGLGYDLGVRWNNVGFDAEDSRIDLVVTWLEDSRWYAMSATTRVPILQRFLNNSFGTAGICIGLDTKSVGTKSCTEAHLRINFYKSGTNIPAVGTFLTRFTDLDQDGWDGTYNDRWVESVEFISGHSSEMFVPNGNVLRIGNNRNGEPATDFRATQKMDGSSLDSGVVVSLANGAEFWYYSTHGWTDILDQFDARSISLSSNYGGSISSSGKQNSVAVGWRGSRTVSIEPQRGYKIADVKVDGWSVGPRSSYTFSNVTENHSIEAVFAPINYLMRFNPNGADGYMEGMWVAYDSTRELPGNAFWKTGYTYTGWNTQANGSGTSYSNGQAIRNLSASDGTAIDLHAQWKPITYAVTFTGGEGTSGSMASQSFTYDQAQGLSKNKFSKKGYEFVSWNTQPDGSGQSFTNAQEVINLAAEQGGIISLYAQWRPVNYYVAYDGQGAQGTMDSQKFTYDESGNLRENTFVKEGFRWSRWDTNFSVPDITYPEQSFIHNLTEIANHVITLFAIWMANRTLVVFEENGGTGEMESQSIAYETPEKLHANSFTRDGYKFKGWNTQADGSGDSYSDEQEVNNLRKQDNITVVLFAQWEKEEPETSGEEADASKDVEAESGGASSEEDADASKDKEASDTTQDSTKDSEQAQDASGQGSSESEASKSGQVDGEKATEYTGEKTDGKVRVLSASDAEETLVVSDVASDGQTTSQGGSENSSDADSEIETVSGYQDAESFNVNDALTQGTADAITAQEYNDASSVFAKTGGAVLPFVCIVSVMLVASIAFILYGMRQRRRALMRKREHIKSLLGI